MLPEKEQQTDKYCQDPASFIQFQVCKQLYLTTVLIYFGTFIHFLQTKKQNNCLYESWTQLEEPTPTILSEVFPQVLWLAEVASVQDTVVDNDAIRLQWRAPAHQHRGGVQSTQLQLLRRCGGPWRVKEDWVSNENPEMRPHSWGMYIVLVVNLTCCVTTICFLVSLPPGYRREGTSRAMGEWTGAQVIIR